MKHYGDIPASVTLPMFFPSYGKTNGESITLTGLAVTDIEIYKGTSITQRSSDNGYALIDTDGIDVDGITGIHGFSIDLSDNSDAGFYAAGSFYTVVVSTVTVDSQVVSFIAGTFRICAAESSAGTPKADVSHWLGTAASPPTVPGVPNVNVKTWNDLTTVALPLVPTTAGRTLDVSVGGEAGVDWANVGSPTTVVGLSGTTIKTATDVETDTQDIQSRLPAALVGGFMSSALGNTAHGGVAATLTLERLIAASTTTNEPGFKVTGNGTAPGVLYQGGATGNGATYRGGATSGSGFYAIAPGTTGSSNYGFWAEGDDAGAYFDGGSYGAYVAGTVGMYIARNDASAAVTFAATNAGIDVTCGSTLVGVQVSASGGDGLNISGGQKGLNISGTRGNDIVSLLSSFNDPGLKIYASSSGSAPGLTVQGSDTGVGVQITGGSTSGNGLNVTTTNGHAFNLDATGSSKVSINAPDGITANITGNLSGSVNNLVVLDEDSTTIDLDATIRAAVGLAAANLDTQLDALPTAAENADAVHDEVVDGTKTFRESTRLANSANAGKLSGAATTNILIRDLADTKNRVNATVDADGNRTAVTLDLT